MGYEKIVTLAERCAKYAQASGKRSILETKPVGKVDVSKLGVCLSDGTVHFQNGVIRYRTAEEATAKAKEITMQQFNVPMEQQIERVIGLSDKNLHIGSPDWYDCAEIPVTIPSIYDCSKRNFRLIHNHPQYNISGDSVPISIGDINSMISNSVKSVTALNRRGEYSIAHIIDEKKAMQDGSWSWKILDEFNNQKILIYMGKNGKRLSKLRKLKKQQKLTTELENELNNLENEYNNFNMDKYIQEKPEEYSYRLHSLYKKLLPQYGIEYKTNFSNLLKYDA